MREYEKSHPWLTFELDLRKLSYHVWLLLGEAQSLCNHIANSPIRPSTSKRLHTLFIAKGALATTAIEGNTLSEEEVVDIVEKKSKISPSKKYLEQEINNILEAFNMIYKRMKKSELRGISSDDMKLFNKLVLKNIEIEEKATPGEIRKYSVGVANYKAVPAQDCEYLLERLSDWLESSFDPPNNESKISFGIIKSIVSHIYFAWIHPFGDGNGRTARLIENYILLSVGVPTPASHLLSNHYNHTRNLYYKNLEKSSKSSDGMIQFLEYAITGFMEGLRNTVSTIRNEQWDIIWRNYVHESFSTKKSSVWTRRRHLALDLSRSLEPVKKSMIREISPRIAEAYANKDRLTISRDINILIEMNLIVENEEGLSANRSIISGFLPQRVDT